jgi:hypothetical protein
MKTCGSGSIIQRHSSTSAMSGTSQPGRFNPADEALAGEWTPQLVWTLWRSENRNSWGWNEIPLLCHRGRPYTYWAISASVNYKMLFIEEWRQYVKEKKRLSWTVQQRELSHYVSLQRNTCCYYSSIAINKITCSRQFVTNRALLQFLTALSYVPGTITLQNLCSYFQVWTEYECTWKESHSDATSTKKSL